MKRQVDVSVKIPVDIEISQLNSQLANLEKAFQKVDLDSAIGKKLTSALDKAMNKMGLLEIASRKAFTSQAEIDKFERGFNDVGDIITLITSLLNKVSFKNLKFNDADLSGIRAAEAEIEKIKQAFDSFKKDVFKDAITSSTTLKGVLESLSINPDKIGIEETVNKIDEAVKRSQRMVENLKSSLSSKLVEKDLLKTKVSDLSGLKKLFSDRTDARFFKAGGTFKKGGKEALTTYLSELGLDEKAIAELQTRTSTTLTAYYDNIAEIIEDKKAQLNAKITKLDKSIPETEAKLQVRTAEQTGRIEAQNELGKAMDSVNAKYEESTARQREYAVGAEELKNRLVETKGVREESNKVEKETVATLGEVTGKTKEASASLGGLATASERLSNIQGAIKRWFGFYEVINLTKSAIRGAISHIRELDKAMTEIAIVTDMTQANLWSQIGAYTALAQQYGVTTTGVYQVSQLYYQQGPLSNI